MLLIQLLKEKTVAVFQTVFQASITEKDIQINDTKPEFAGEYTIVTFPFTRMISAKPEEIGQKIGEGLVATYPELFLNFNVIKGFLNIEINPDFYVQFLNKHYTDKNFGKSQSTGKKIMIEYSSPNTNKPLHFGHLRNIFLGYALSNILQETGHEVIKANLINDRGIHICKSMIAWMKFGNGATPESTGIKGDHLVGDYYVRFNDAYKQEVTELIKNGVPEEAAAKQAPILLEAQDLLRKWEAGDPETINLWKTMNQWVYDGFTVSYKRLGVNFDKYYYESDTYLLGKDVALQGLEKGILYQKEDQSVWIDLTEDGLDHKLLLRGDGTSVYMTQDIGTAILKYKDFNINQSVYVIGDEQNYHMQVLALILKKLQEPCADGIFHLSYGMVELPSGRMKSREGTVVDADDMMDEMTAIAQKNTEELGKVDGFNQDELHSLFHTLGMGALKFYLLRVDPKRKMIFNPQESIDFHGFTGPFIQYTHARIASILRKAGDTDLSATLGYTMSAHEKSILKHIETYPAILQQSASEMNPAVVCNYVFNLAKEFNAFLVNHSILKAAQHEAKVFRLQLAHMVKYIIAHSLQLLGIDSPERM